MNHANAIRHAVIDSPVGPLLLAADDTHLQVLEFETPAHPVKRGAHVTGLEQDGLELHAGVLGRALGQVEDLLDLVGPAGDVHVERHRPVDLDDVDADQLGLVGLRQLRDELHQSLAVGMARERHNGALEGLVGL